MMWSVQFALGAGGGSTNTEIQSNSLFLRETIPVLRFGVSLECPGVFIVSAVTRTQCVGRSAQHITVKVRALGSLFAAVTGRRRCCYPNPFLSQQTMLS